MERSIKSFIENFWGFIRNTCNLLISLFNIIVALIYIFIISPFIPIYDLGKEYIKKLKENKKNYGGVSFKNIELDYELLKYFLALIFLLLMTFYFVFSTPYTIINGIQNEQKRNNYLEEVVYFYESKHQKFKEDYSNDVFQWFDKYNEARNKRNCDFMRTVDIDLLQWEKDTIKSIPKDKKYDEHYVLRNNYNCYSYDNIHEKNYLLPVEIINIEIKESPRGKDEIILVTGYLTHSKIQGGEFVGLSKRKFTLRKIVDWDVWRIHSIKPI
ncbi:hypothetical protein [Candidatus Absconditicoccus praedator]|uniref:hypothetical protein n=1 Tax=Candidatus Absconditicoccus praedator TaxID=2735562 RepID=UPI001E37AE82|nr:hypothetical protein [Candidatus Absconditicoccus praedator]UFX82603.1 hypothetical protein HLG78_00420 [Candidatus Absconditicoccus praedator]